MRVDLGKAIFNVRMSGREKLLYKIVQSPIPENTSPSQAPTRYPLRQSVPVPVCGHPASGPGGILYFHCRCADHVLAGTERLVRIFIYADMWRPGSRGSEKGYYEE